VVVGIGRVVDEGGAVAGVVGLLAVVVREEVPMRPAGAVAGGVVERGQVVACAGVVEAVDVLGVALDPGAVIVGDAVVPVEELAVHGIDPMEPAAVEAPGLDPVEVAATCGVDEEVDPPVAAGANVTVGDSSGRCLREADRVRGRDLRVVGAGDRADGTGWVAIDGDLRAEHLGMGGAKELLVPLVGQVIRWKLHRADELHVARHGEGGRFGPGECTEPAR
jgi:hypothetical protein